MAMLLRADNLARSFSHRPLFAAVSFSIEDGERIGLIGPNGSGKSTLLKILAGMEEPDAGEFTRRRNLRIAYIAQHDRFDDSLGVLAAIEHALEDELHDPNERHERAIIAVRQIGFDDLDQPVGALSGGWRKRLAIARELAREPDILLLDEPTNHLDLEGIEWLESTLRRMNLACVIVTHDRFFLERACTRIVELSHAYPEGTFSVQGGYDEFLRRRDEFMHAQRQEQVTLANRVRQDIKWLSRGPKARRTKAKSRIEDSHGRMDQLAQLKARNDAGPTAGVAFSETGRKTRKLLVAHGLAKSLGGRLLFQDVNIELMPGDCLGLLGPNGSGKTTLIRLLTGEMKPDAGSIERADGLKTVIFSQHRETLDPKQTLSEALGAHADTVIFRGKSMHIVTWAQRFLFKPEQLPSPVSLLSGGEQSRVLLARMMLEPADLLILDEPTNDLDIPTLEVLESSLEEFPGAIVLVTHDRFMLQRLSTDVLGLDGEGNARMFADFFQWESAQRERSPSTKSEAPKPREADKRQGTATTKKKLSYNEQREWDAMETTIHRAEETVARLEKVIADPKIIADHAKMQKACNELEESQQEVARLYERWAELEARQR